MRVEVQLLSAPAQELRRAAIGGDLLFDDADEPGAWQFLLPSLHWRTEGDVTHSCGDTTALDLTWATLMSEARELTFGNHATCRFPDGPLARPGSCAVAGWHARRPKRPVGCSGRKM
eukprot:6188538-Pleurochrysis_carterae.AAC.1